MWGPRFASTWLCQQQVKKMLSFSLPPARRCDFTVRKILEQQFDAPRYQSARLHRALQTDALIDTFWHGYSTRSTKVGKHVKGSPHRWETCLLRLAPRGKKSPLIYPYTQRFA